MTHVSPRQTTIGIRALSIGCVLAALGAWGCIGEPSPGLSDCEVGGITYPHGSAVPAEDTCNSCACNDGRVLCTLIACEPKICGGLQGGTCDADEYCAYREGDLCGAADATAECLPRPDFCPDIYAPVCACGDRTYPNACAAAQAGLGVLHGGECEPPAGASCELDGVTYPDGTSGIPAPDGCDTCSCDDGRLACTLRLCVDRPCGGRLGDTCEKDEYCAYEGGDCGMADGTAVCRPRPQVCTREYNPVCACNGQTYPNACTAAAAGFGYLHEGLCEGDVVAP